MAAGRRALQRRGPPEREPSAATPRASRTRIMTRISQTRCTSFNCSSNEVFGPFSNPLRPLVYRYCYLFVIWHAHKRGGFGGPTRPVADKRNRGSSASDAVRRFRRRGIWRGRQATDRKCWTLRAGRLWRRPIGENGESSANSPALWPCGERRPGSRRPLMGQSRGWTGGWTCESGSNGRPRRSAMN
jgi:hypothetical protein